MKTILLITLTLFCSIYGISQAGNLPSPRSISISHTSCMIEVDGSRSDELWTHAEVHEFPYNIEGTAVPASDIYPQIQLAWNSDLGIFAFVHIIDDIDWYFDAYWYSLDDDDDFKYFDGPWHRDNVEFFFYWGLEGEWGPEQDSSSTSDPVWSQIRFNVCYYAEEELETCLTVYAPGLEDDDKFYLGAPGSTPDSAFIDAVAIATQTGWDLEVIFPFDIFVKRTDLNTEEDIPIGFECFVNDAENQIFHDTQLFLLNDKGIPATWQDRRYLNTAILKSPNFANIECETTGVSESCMEQVTLFKTIHNGIIASQEINEIKIYHLLGSLVLHKQKLEPGRHLFNLNPGIYFISVNDTFVEKMIVE